MATEQFSNNATSTLTGAILAADVTLVVLSAATFPTTGNFRITIDSEIMIVTAVSGSTFTVTRGAESTTAANHSNGATVDGILTSGGLAAFQLDFPMPRATTVARSNTTLSGTQTVNGVALIAGNVCLCPYQTTETENGPWVVASGAWTRPVWFATGSSGSGVSVTIQSGAWGVGVTWVCTTTVASSVVGTNKLAFRVQDRGHMVLPPKAVSSGTAWGTGSLTTERQGGLWVYKVSPGASHELAGIGWTLPASSYSFRARVKSRCAGNAVYPNAGICVRNTSTGLLEVLSLGITNSNLFTVTVRRYSSTTVEVSSPFSSETGNTMVLGSPLGPVLAAASFSPDLLGDEWWLRIDDNATNRTFYLGTDDNDTSYVSLYSGTAAGYATPDQYAVYVDPHTFNAAVDVSSIAVTTP